MSGLSTRDCRGTLSRIKVSLRFYSFCSSYEGVEKFAVLFGPDSPTSRSVPQAQNSTASVHVPSTFTDISLWRSVPDRSYMVTHVRARNDKRLKVKTLSQQFGWTRKERERQRKSQRTNRKSRKTLQGKLEERNDKDKAEKSHHKWHHNRLMIESQDHE